MSAPRRRRQRKRKSSSPAAVVRTTLQSQVAALERRQSKLIRKIARKQEQIAEFTQGCRELGSRLAARLEPVVERGRALDNEIHAMFRCILTTRKFGKRSYKSILGVYMSLQEAELISTRPFDPEGGDGQAEGFEDEPDDADDWHFPRPEPSRGREASKSGLRAVFLHLASQFHPDLATSADGEHLHTEIMKELTRAYREGDMARLLEMKRELDSRGGIESGEVSLEDYCARLKEQVALLQGQLRSLAQHLEAVRDTHLGRIFTEYRRMARSPLGDPIDLFIQEFEDEFEGLEEVARFVRQFHDGQMTIKRFLEGPVVFEYLDDDDLLDDEDLVVIATFEYDVRRKRSY